MRLDTKLPRLLQASFLALVLATLSGCGSQQLSDLGTSHNEDRATAQKGADNDESNTNTVAPSLAEKKLATQDYPVRAFPTQTFYELLVAEFAGIRGDLPLAANKYIEQANITRDPNVVERAIRTASFANNEAKVEPLVDLWVEVDPNNYEARKLAFFYLARRGKIDTAFEYAAMLLDQGDGEPLVALPSFTTKLSHDSRARLIDSYIALEKTNSLDRNILLGQIRLRGQQGEMEQALLTSNILLELEPDNEEARLAIAQLLHSHKESAKAVATINAGIERNPDSKKLNLQLIRFLASDDLSAAQTKMVELVTRHPDDFDLQFSLGLLNKQLGLREQARGAFTKMISHNRRVTDAHFQLALMAEDDHQTDEAMLHYAKVGEGNKFLPAVARLAQLMGENGQLDEARLYLHRLRLKKPGMVVALYRLESEILIGAERYDSALSLLTDGLEQHPENFDLLYSRSLVSEKLNDIASMEQDLRTILDHDTNNASALNALGYSLANHTKRYDEALSLIRQAIAITPGDPAVIDSLGWVLYRLGNSEEALVHLRQALASIPDAEVAAHLGEVLWMSGEKDEALSIWHKALESEPDSKYLLDTIERFEVEF